MRQNASASRRSRQLLNQSQGNDSCRVQFARRIATGDASLRLYGILDAESCVKRGLNLLAVASAWRAAGISLVQYRDKVSPLETVKARAHALRKIFAPGTGAFLFLNDFVDLAAACDFDGVHVGQTDTSVAAARLAMGPDKLIGISTHTPDQAMEAERSDCDYVAIGPVFSTTTKLDAEPAIGVCGVQAARALVRKPLVAIGGIGLDRVKRVMDAGAGMVAVISGLLDVAAIPPENTQHAATSAALTKHAQDFLLRLK